MPFWIFILIMDLLLPITFIVLGLIYIIRPPKKINQISGYRTSMSMKNIETWVFAHKVFGRILLPLGSILLSIAVVIAVLLFDYDIITISIICGIEVFVQLISLFISYVFVERILKREFDENGIPR